MPRWDQRETHTDALQRGRHSELGGHGNLLLEALAGVTENTALTKNKQDKYIRMA